MRSFNLPCTISNHSEFFVAYLGSPSKGANPLAAQIRWLSEYRSRNVPQEVTDAFAKLLEIAEHNNSNFEELLDYAFTPDKKNAPAKKILDALNLKDKVLDLEKLRRLATEGSAVPKLDKPVITALRNFAGLPKQPIYSLLKKNYLASLEYCLGMSHDIWRHNDGCHPAARALFLGLCLASVEISDPLVGDLADVLQKMTSPDIMHTLAIIIDVAGGILSPLALGLVRQAFRYDASFMVNMLQPFISISLAEYALDPHPNQKADAPAADGMDRRHPP